MCSTCWLSSSSRRRQFARFNMLNRRQGQGRPLGGATGAVAPGPAPRDERNRTPPRNAIANGPRGAPLHTSHRAPRQPGTALVRAIGKRENSDWMFSLANESVPENYSERDENKHVNEGGTDRRLLKCYVIFPILIRDCFHNKMSRLK